MGTTFAGWIIPGTALGAAAIGTAAATIGAEATRLGGGGGISSGPLVTPTLLIMNHGGRDYEELTAGAQTLSAYDKTTGEHLGSVDLPAVPGGNPISYMHHGNQYIALAVGSASGDNRPELVALRLP